MVGDWLYWEKTLPGFHSPAQKITLADDPAAKMLTMHCKVISTAARREFSHKEL